jgi:hypothetical protein
VTPTKERKTRSVDSTTSDEGAAARQLERQRRNAAMQENALQQQQAREALRQQNSLKQQANEERRRRQIEAVQGQQQEQKVRSIQQEQPRVRERVPQQRAIQQAPHIQQQTVPQTSGEAVVKGKGKKDKKDD